jgi:RNA polymerase sigma-70 factor (ECF subfamily)
MERGGPASRDPAIQSDGTRATHRPSPSAGCPPPAAPDQPSGGLRVWTDERDEVLAEQASRGDERAFEVLVDRYQRVIFNLTLRISGNREDARELTQDVFVKMWRGLRGFDPKRRFFSWTYRIAIHESLNLRRRSGRQEALEAEPEAKEDGPERRFEALEMETRVQEALDELSDGDRQLLVLRHFLDHTYEEIAEVLGVPAGKVKSRLYTARQRLRGALEKGARP